jgi:hypothetical protein
MGLLRLDNEGWVRVLDPRIFAYGRQMQEQFCAMVYGCFVKEHAGTFFIPGFALRQWSQSQWAFARTAFAKLFSGLGVGGTLNSVMENGNGTS